MRVSIQISIAVLENTVLALYCISGVKRLFAQGGDYEHPFSCALVKLTDCEENFHDKNRLSINFDDKSQF
jgi:hypothetical protein